MRAQAKPPRKRPRRAPLALALTLLAAPLPALAQPPPDPILEEAREAFRIGSTLAKQAAWTDALASFERSSKLKPHAVTTFNIAFCERALGHFTRARRNFQRALAAPDKELPPNLATEALGYMAEIDHRLARVRVTALTPHPSVSVDGRPLDITGGTPAHLELTAGTREPGPPEPVASLSFDLLLDPGTHVVVYTVPGSPDGVTTRDFAADSTTTLTLGTSPARPTGPSVARKAGAGVAFSLGGLGLLAGAIFGGVAFKEKGDLDAQCMPKNQCPKGAQGTIDAMNGFAAGSTAGFVIGGAGVVAGTIVVVTGRPAQGVGVEVVPWVGVGVAGVRGRF